MGAGAGFDLLAQGNVQNAERASAYKQKEAYDAHEAKINDLIKKRTQLSENAKAFGKDTPDHKEALGALQQVDAALKEAYDPSKHPGAIQRFGHLLTNHLGITKPNPLNLYANPEQEPANSALAFNQPWAKQGPYVTKLSPEDEQKFQAWVQTTKVPWQDTPNADYDMRGYWQALVDPNNPNHALTGRVENGAFKGHFSDKWKTPYSGVFSRESMYATPNAPHWVGDKLVTSNGKLVSNETPGYKMPRSAQKELKARQQRANDALKEANLDVAAGPLSPTQEANAKAAATLASVQAAAKSFSTLNPDATDEEKQSFLTDLIQKTYGTTVAGNWKIVKGTLNGQPASVLFDSKTRQIRTLGGENLPPDLLATWVPQTNTTEAANKRADFDAYKKEHPDYKGTFEQWAAQQGAIGRAGGNPLKFNPATGQIQDLTTGTLYNENDPTNPSQVASMFKASNDFQAKKQAFQIKLAKIRSASYGEARQMAPLQVFDTANGNAPTYATFLEMKKQPGRYIPAGPAAKALTQENLMEDLTGVSGILRTDITDMKEDFPEAMKAKIAFATQAEDPAGALNALVASGALGSLPDDQFKVYVDLQQLAENAMAMRSVLGAGQGSDQVRSAIRATLPSLLSPNKKDALVQLDAYDKTIARLRRGIPKVQLRTDIGNGTNPAAGASLPPAARARLKEGMITTFSSGQSWTLENGQPKRVK